MMFSTVQFPCGKIAPNPFVLAPLTNQQSFEDGNLSPEESHWLRMRARGGFGLVTTCAAFVERAGSGLDNQMGIHKGLNSKSHQALHTYIHQQGALSIVQLYHAGSRANLQRNGGVALVPDASAHPERMAKSLSLTDIQTIENQFISAAVLAKSWGYDGVQLHVAHGYLLCEFLSTLNQRTDQYGGSLANKTRIIQRILEEIRGRCGSDFLISVRLSPERFGLNTAEVLEVAQHLVNLQIVDNLDWSLWNVDKVVDGTSLLTQVMGLQYSQGDYRCIVSVAGNIQSSQKVQHLLNEGVDMVSIGRGAILHHDFPKRCLASDFQIRSLPISRVDLLTEGVSSHFAKYLTRWDNFVAQ